MTEYRCEWVSGPRVDEAIELRRRVYTEEFGFDLGGNGPRDALDDRSHHLLATTLAGEPVASLRMIDAPARPFEIESFLDLGSLIESSWHPAEITRLCILAPHRRVTSATFLLHLSILEAVLRQARHLGVTHLVASTRNELMPLYQYLLFDTYPDVTYDHPEIGNARHTLMSLDLRNFAETCRQRRPTLLPAAEAAQRDEGSR